MIYFDNSATTNIKPQTVKNALNMALQKYSVNPGRGGYKASEDTSLAVYNARKNIDSFFGGYGAENVIFTGSCTMALNQVIFGLLKPGDHCVISDMEHNAVMRPLNKLKAMGVEYTSAVTYPGDNEKTLDSFRKALRKNTKLVICTAASNVWGIRLPFERITALCRLYDIKICVDMAQGAGLIPVNMKECGIDFMCFPAHKGLYGVMGLGVLMMKENESLEPLIYGGTGVNSISLDQPDFPPERYESGTLNVPGILALSAGIDFVKRAGVNRIRKSETDKLSYIYDRLKRHKKITLYTERPDTDNFVPVLAFNTELPSEEMGKMFSMKGIALRCGLHCAPEAHRKFGTESKGAVRISPSFFTSENECEYFLKVTEGIVKNI